MTNDGRLKDEVEAALERNPSIAGSPLHVQAHEGVVSLFGEVRSYAARMAAADAARHVPGVRSITLGITVHPSDDCRRADSVLAHCVRFALRRNTHVPSTVRAKVDKGWVTLSGEVCRYVQRDAAERAIAWLDGVLGVTNEIRVEAECTAAEAAETLRAMSARRAVGLA